MLERLAEPSPVPAGAIGAGATATVALQRAVGRVSVGFADDHGRTRLRRLFQECQMKARLPRIHGDEPVTAVLINTAGGVTGGDRLEVEAVWDAATRAVVTSQAAERIYRSSGGDGRLETRLEIGPGADAEWLPQETILFDRARLSRRLDVDLAPDASLLMVESLFLGRAAMGETVRTAFVSDHWRIRIGGRLVHAEALRLDGDPEAILAGAATGAGAIATATILMAGPRWVGEAGQGAEQRIDALRALAETEATDIGVGLVHGLIVVRLIDRDAARLRATVVRLLEFSRGRACPRPWMC